MQVESGIDLYGWFLSLFSIGGGLILLIIAYYVRKKTVAATRLVDQLLKCAEMHEGDPLTFFKKSEALLKKAGAVCVYMEIVWFGKLVKLGTFCGKKVDERFCNSYVLGGDEIEAKILICRKRMLRGETLVVYQALEKLWRQLLSSQINSRIAQVHFSQQNVQRYALFYKHDLKNLAQFMELLSVQMTHCDAPECSYQLLKQLKQILPNLQLRAHRILRSLAAGFKENAGEMSQLDIAALIQQEAMAVGIQVKLSGEGSILASERPLRKALQGILENFKQHGQTKNVQVTIERDGGALKLLFTTPELKGRVSEEQIARMFEPFWTTSKSGMGLGLYLAREHIKQACHGQLDIVQVTPEQWGFEILCPIVSPSA